MNALILADLQNDFCPGGALAVPQGDQMIVAANRLQPLFDLVVATQDWHPASHGSFAASHPGKKPGDTIELAGLRQILWPVHCVQGTQGADFHAGLDQSRIARIFRKGDDPILDSYSGFFDNGHHKSTGMDEYLRERGVTGVYVCGLATDYCVKWTALDAVDLGFKTYLIEDACRGVNANAGDVQRAIQQMQAKGVIVIRSDQLPKSIASAADCSERGEPRILGEGRFARLLSYRGWEWVERTNTSAAAVIVAITEQRELLLVEQYRIPLGRRVIELPAGLVGDLAENKQEGLEEAARRELLEETGYEAGRIDYLLEGPTSPGLANEVYTLLLARDVRKVGPGGGDATEDIQVHVVPLDKVEAWSESKRRAGLMVSPKIYSALYFAAQ
jgi:nicotinamidase-related amidase/8-oxo-dGTP pyrophosphatase MutT (NUDIX family)